MKLSDFRANLENWLGTVLRVDGYDLDNPALKPTVINTVAYPPNRVLRYPLTKMVVDALNCKVSFDIRYDVVYRFRKSTPYHSLPIVDLEVTALTLLNSLMLSVGDISDNLAIVEPLEIDSPVMVAVNESNQDWLCTLSLLARVTLYFEPEIIPETIQPNLIGESAPTIESVIITSHLENTPTFTTTINLPDN